MMIVSCVSSLVIMSSKGLILSTGCSYGRTHPSIPTYLSTIHTYLPVYHIYLPELSHAPSYMFYHHIIAYHEWTTRTGELLLLLLLLMMLVMMMMLQSFICYGCRT